MLALHGAGHRPRRRRAAHLAGRLVRLSALDLPTVPTTASAPNLQGGTHVSELVTLEPDEQPLALTTLSPDSPGLALGTARRRGQAGQPRGAGRGRLGGHPAGARRPGRRRRRAGQRRTSSWSSSPPTPSCCTSPPRPSARRAASGGGMAGIKLAAGARAVFFGAVPPPRRRPGRHGGRQLRGAAGHRRGHGQGDPVQRVPGQGPGHRRRPLPPVPARRGHPAAGLGRARRRPWPPRPAARRSTCPRPTAAADGSGAPAGQPIAAVASHAEREQRPQVLR